MRPHDPNPRPRSRRPGGPARRPERHPQPGPRGPGDRQTRPGRPDRPDSRRPGRPGRNATRKDHRPPAGPPWTPTPRPPPWPPWPNGSRVMRQWHPSYFEPVADCWASHPEVVIELHNVMTEFTRDLPDDTPPARRHPAPLRPVAPRHAPPLPRRHEKLRPRRMLQKQAPHVQGPLQMRTRMLANTATLPRSCTQIRRSRTGTRTAVQPPCRHDPEPGRRDRPGQRTHQAPRHGGGEHENQDTP